MLHLYAIRVFGATAVLLVCILGQNASTTCVFEDGQEFQPGENVGDSFTNRCGNSTEYPCFCDPTVSFQVYCPYCGFAAGDGTLHCARDSETISFPDGSLTRECSCDFSDDPAEDPTRNCTVLGEQPPVTGGGGQCILPDANGNMVEIENGESFGELIEGACGPASEWPSFCRVMDDQGDFEIEYPYCVQNGVASGETVCAKDGESVSYVNDDGVDITCSCAYTSDEGSDAECQESDRQPSPPGPSDATSVPTSSPASVPIPAPSGSSYTNFNRGQLPLLIVSVSCYLAY